MAKPVKRWWIWSSSKQRVRRLAWLSSK
jgi:hypothetical protein